MTDDGKIVQAAQYLVQRNAASESLDIMLQDCAPTTIEDAYKVQDAFLDVHFVNPVPVDCEDDNG